MAKKAKKGDTVENTKPIFNRVAFYKKNGKPGRTKKSFKKGKQHRAATDELGGNIWIDAKVKNDDVLVPFGEGEWKRV